MPTFRPDALVFFRAKKTRALKKTRASGRNVGKVFNPVVKLVLENQPFLITKLVCGMYNATQALYHAHSQLAGVLPFLSVHMMLEESPCWTCGSECIPSIVAQMDQQRIPVQLVAMLPYSPNSVFLERLTEYGGPVQLKPDLCPFEERHACMVHGRCGHVRCHEHCHYSKPSKVLAVKKGTLRYHELHAAEQVRKQRKK